MVVQVTLGGEIGLASFLFTLVGSLPCVKAHVCLQVALLVECFLTIVDRTDKITVTLVLFQMYF